MAMAPASVVDAHNDKCDKMATLAACDDVPFIKPMAVKAAKWNGPMNPGDDGTSVESVAVDARNNAEI